MFFLVYTNKPDVVKAANRLSTSTTLSENFAVASLVINGEGFSFKEYFIEKKNQPFLRKNMGGFCNKARNFEQRNIFGSFE